MSPHNTTNPLNLVLFACTAFLAAEPALWLVRTWLDASWNSSGEVAFFAVLAMFAWSVSSRRRGDPSTTVPALLFALTAAVRVAGHLLAVNVIGALALVIDVFAIGLLLGVHRRERAVSPFWLAALFGLALPLERIIQRVVGFGLQQVSAAGACGALSVGFDDVSCRGVDILLAGQHVLVDLPCSGARGLLLLCGAFVGLAALSRPRPAWAVLGVAVTVLAAMVSNTVRIVALAIGIAFGEIVGVDVMAQPWHDIIGLAALALGLAPIIVWSRWASETAPFQGGRICAPTAAQTGGPHHRTFTAALLIIACAAVLLTPHQPIDVARPVEHLAAPHQVAGHRARTIPLTEQERDYFTQFGGAAAKTRFGERTVLLVRTSAPLRHLHAPDECLVGAGFDVERLGITHGAMPGATYRAVSPDGRVWRVVVTYQSDAGHVATSVSEAVWIWLRNPNTTWTAVERVHPWNMLEQHNDSFDRSLLQSLEQTDHLKQEMS